MPIEYRKQKDELVWVRNPFTGSVTYFTHVHKKRSGFLRQAPSPAGPPRRDPSPSAAPFHTELEAAKRACAFCPGNEEQTPKAICEVPVRQVFPDRHDAGWLIRAFPNLIPRIPEYCTGGRNESYVVVEDPRHFADAAVGHDDLLYSGLLPLEQFQALLMVNLDVARRAHANPDVRAVLIRKNQGRESGASQPHVHNQVIGSDIPFAVVARECEVTAQAPRVWHDIVAFARTHGFFLEERSGCCVYFCPFGTFPRSYEVVCLDDWVRAVDLPAHRWKVFVSLLYGVLNILGPIPLDYEIHDGPGVPLHAHINARHFPYSNIGGTLNLPFNLVVNRLPSG